MQFARGDILSDKYRVEERLGEGGMGFVLAATHLELGQKVAIKFMKEEVLGHADIRVRFMREARAAGRLKSVHTARVLDVGTLPDGMPYIVMEYLRGADLSSHLRKRGKLPVPEVAEYMLQTCEALHEAHASGIVHRDLKPANLFLTEGPGGRAVIKVLDFGVSKVMGHGWDEGEQTTGERSGRPDPTMLTRLNDFLGSPNYMAPEQIKSAKDADAQSDVWSIGVIMYRLSTGKLPFTGDSDDELVYKITRAPIPELRALLPDVSPEFESVVRRCMERDRKRRYRSVEELAYALAPLAENTKTPSLERIALVRGAALEPDSRNRRERERERERDRERGRASTSQSRRAREESRRSLLSPTIISALRSISRSVATGPGGRSKNGLYLFVIVASLIIMGGAVAMWAGGEASTPHNESRPLRRAITNDPPRTNDPATARPPATYLRPGFGPGPSIAPNANTGGTPPSKANLPPNVAPPTLPLPTALPTPSGAASTARPPRFVPRPPPATPPDTAFTSLVPPPPDPPNDSLPGIPSSRE